MGALLQTPAPVLDQISGPMAARFLSSAGLGSGNLRAPSTRLSAAFYAAHGFTGAFGRNLCKFTFPQRRRNLRKSLNCSLPQDLPKGPDRTKNTTA